MKIDKRELEKPIIKKADGTFATLKEILEEPVRVVLRMGPEDYTDLALARFDMTDPDVVFSVFGKGSFRKDQILMEIKRGTEVGQTFVKMQERFIKYLLNRRGEIDAGEHS